MVFVDDFRESSGAIDLERLDIELGISGLTTSAFVEAVGDGFDGNGWGENGLDCVGSGG